MRGTSSRWVGALVAVAAGLAVATSAQAHPADWSYRPGEVFRQVGSSQTGMSAFMEREAATPGSFSLVGSNPLLGRGMNAALAVGDGYAYVGSRTDGKNANANHAGVLVVDVHDPTKPNIVHEIGPPWEGNAQESSRELRVWRSQHVLIVLHTNCGGNGAHQCAQPNKSSIRYYDISGENAAHPQLLYQQNQDTHEFFLWEDPSNPQRALLFGADATTQWRIYDISPVVQGKAPIQLFSGRHNYSGAGLHSFSVTNDGKRAYFALLTGGFAVADVSDFTSGKANPQYRQITPPANRPIWPGPGAHSAVKLWNSNWVYVSDEVYGTATAAGHGCPWGWARMIDAADPTHPIVRSEFRMEQNQPLLCNVFEPRPRTSFSAHNPTLTPHIAFSTWHSSGFVAIDISDPAAPTLAAQWSPEPLAMVGTEDPRLSMDDQKVVMWSYPVIADGLIYTVDLRNGLYILKYEGPHQQEVSDVTFLEGNSNQGDALCYEPVGTAPRECKTDATQSAGGTVPATLALTLGPAASLGSFTPGVAKEYTATTTANVISTAGDAALSVADPSPTATGHLVNGSFSLPQALQARALNAANPNLPYADVGSSASPTLLLGWSNPVSNDPVSLGFRQVIGANDALRTGSYSKTVTFTLSTTTP